METRKKPVLGIEPDPDEIDTLDDDPQEHEPINKLKPRINNLQRPIERPSRAVKNPVKRPEKNESLIDFHEELLNYQPLLDVDDIEDSIRFDEMADAADVLIQLLKSAK